MDEPESEAVPNTPGKIGVSRRTVMQAGTTAPPVTTLPRAALTAGPVDNREGASIRLIVAAAIAIVAIDTAIPYSMAVEPNAGPPAHAAEYLPSISDLMIATIQPRHERLWRAEQDKNWEFAAYEAGNLRGAFIRLGIAHPVEHDISFPEMIGSVTELPLKKLDSAIQSKDHTAFAKAYAELTEACNSCHMALNHGVVKIGVPNRTSASDLNTGSTSPN